MKIKRVSYNLKSLTLEIKRLNNSQCTTFSVKGENVFERIMEVLTNKILNKKGTKFDLRTHLRLVGKKSRNSEEDYVNCQTYAEGSVVTPISDSETPSLGTPNRIMIHTLPDSN